MMSSGGRGSVGFCGTTKNRIDSSASYTADYSGVGEARMTSARRQCRFSSFGLQKFVKDWFLRKRVQKRRIGLEGCVKWTPEIGPKVKV
jgi:hypothetical protein